MNSLKTIELIELISDGDRNAFRSVFLSYFPKVKYFIVHLIKEEAAAEDISQDIFIKIWENRVSLKEIQSFDAYIYKMAKNAVINEFKKKDLEEKYYNYNYSSSQENYISIEEELFAKEIRLLTELTVSKMPEQRRKIYEMSRMEGIKNEDIAKKLGITKKTVENHINLALKEIRKTISFMLLFFI
ncbi:MAG: RNA polymerase sigma-70 factor [Prevotella sp.]|jgi:RNA polymerase sigma-70 factor (ECF subfamily)|nr:RNA polymerase sigma-70 factor [Prevotella sp.]